MVGNSKNQQEIDDQLDMLSNDYIEDLIEVETVAPKAPPMFTDRMHDLIVKKNGEVIHKYEGLTQAIATRWRREYRNEGFQVDMIETSTTITSTGERIVFTEKNYVPALEGRIPGTVEMSEARASQKRNEEHGKMVRKMHKNHKPKETINEDYKIWNKETGNLVFKGNDREIVAYLRKNTDFRLSEHVAYLPEKVVAKLVRNDIAKEEEIAFAKYQEAKHNQESKWKIN